MGNINSVKTNPPSRIPGERVSKEAQKAQQIEALKEKLQNANAGNAGAGEAVATGAIIGGLLGGMAGAVLKLPNNTSYTIQPGDNLTAIAKKHLGPEATGNQIEKFINKTLDLNEDIIDNPHQLYKGDTIALPGLPEQGQAQNIKPFVD